MSFAVIGIFVAASVLAGICIAAIKAPEGDGDHGHGHGHHGHGHH
ncbi:MULTISPECIES: hypothetical protein [Azospirillaceae]|jgi:hypothetical protein|nr:MULTISPECIES: hypothetical protein [Azospirillaceae]MDG5497001.1 hypothetical protein [Niveispirillum sp. BGYR6]SNS84479.1 hypothetical protein SAMN05880556_11357 [Azospirillum sp. RU38E]SNT01800.1 hypothetical protein SAMN05880591_11356 [Azospirillum sp. RU37A]